LGRTGALNFSEYHTRTTRDLPWKVGLELLAKITIIADYYQCIDAIQFMALSWYAFLKPTCSDLVRPKDIVLWLWVSWVLRLPEQFRKVGAIAMEQLDERMDSLGLPIPRKILGEFVNLGYLQ
jgi:hypothetical protein